MKTILLVEDAPDLAQVIQRELSAEGFQVLHAADGLSGLELAQRLQPDLIVLDWMLPGIDGLEVLRRLRTFSPVPVLMLTARKEEIDRVIGLEVGADDYLTKPFGTRELTARIRALLRRIERVEEIRRQDRQDAPQLLTYGPLALDPARREASLDGQFLELTPIEFGLLQLFMRSPGMVFNRDYLLDAVWGTSYISGDRSVDSAIVRLRKKLGPLGSAVEAVWGVGYRLRRGGPNGEQT